MVLSNPIEFQWDRGNINKNYLKHNVTNQEIEEVFFDGNKKINKDVLHAGRERRFQLIGRTTLGRILFVVFTLRDKNIRVISARDLNKKEVSLYEKAN